MRHVAHSHGAGNAQSNDHDGEIDCDDYDCTHDPLSKARCGKTETGRECLDGIDNDHDGKSDCADPDCLRDKRIQQRCRIELAKEKAKKKKGGGH